MTETRTPTKFIRDHLKNAINNKVNSRVSINVRHAEKFLEKLNEIEAYQKRQNDLLKASAQLLQLGIDSPYALDIGAIQIIYDGSKCDGFCLHRDIIDLIKEQEND